MFRRRFRRRLYRKRRPMRRRRVARRNKNNGTRFFKLRTITSITSGITQINDNPSSVPQWTAISSLFGFYRVAAMQIKIIPQANMVTMGTTQGFRTTQILHDWDLIQGTPTADTITQHEATKFFRADRPIKFYRKMVRTQPGTANQIRSYNGFMSTSQPTSTQRLLISIDNTTAAVGDIIVTRYLAVRQRI